MNVSNHWTPLFCDWPVECVQSLDSNVLWLTCWMCPIIGLQCSVIDLLNVSNHWTPMFCDWPVECVQSLDSNVLWLTCCSHTTLHYCILFFIYWIDLLKVRVYIFYFTMYYKLLHYLFKEKIGTNIFLLAVFSFVYDLQMYICILYVIVFFYIFWWCTQMYIYILYINVFFYILVMYTCTFICYMLIKYTLLYLFGSLTWLISMVRSIYKSIEKNLAHSRLNISWGVWTKLCTQYMERSRSSKVISQRSRKKIEFDIFVIAVSLCPTCNPIPLETFKYQKEEMIIVSGT